jgi:hypothetical protein
MERPQTYADVRRLMATIRSIEAQDPAKAPACHELLGKLATAEHRLRLEWRAGEPAEILRQAHRAVECS